MKLGSRVMCDESCGTNQIQSGNQRWDGVIGLSGLSKVCAFMNIKVFVIESLVTVTLHK